MTRKVGQTWLPYSWFLRKMLVKKHDLKKIQDVRKGRKRGRNLPIMAVAEIIMANTSKTILMFQYNFVSILITKSLL